MIVQNVAVEERLKNETKRVGNGILIDTVTTVGLQEIVKSGGTVYQLYEEVFKEENFKLPPFRKLVKNFFMRNV